MPEPHRTPAGIPAIDLGKVLAGRDGRTPAPGPALRRSDRRLPAQMAAARTRRLPPPVRSLPRRGGC